MLQKSARLLGSADPPAIKGRKWNYSILILFVHESTVREIIALACNMHLNEANGTMLIRLARFARKLFSL